MRSLAVILVLLAAGLAGCASPAATDDPAPPAPAPRPGEPAPGSPETDSLAWGDEAQATIRPGVQVATDVGQCTANFVFTSPDGLDTYVGLAAHCVEGLELGAPADIGHGAATGALAYSSWATMDAIKEADEAVRDANDFALILLPREARALVHPAMRHFGGPTALADSATLAQGDKVLTYGNSGLRQEIDPAGWHEGYVVEPGEWTTTIYTATPGIPGDSGSGVLTGDGQALGILVTLTIAPLAGSNGVTHLDRALPYAAEHAGIRVVLATAALEDPGLLPAR